MYNMVPHDYNAIETIQGRVGQSVTYLAADTPRGREFNPARVHTFMEIDHEMISTVILLLSTDSRSVVVSYKQKYMHEVLVNCLVKRAKEKNLVR